MTTTPPTIGPTMMPISEPSEPSVSSTRAGGGDGGGGDGGGGDGGGGGGGDGGGGGGARFSKAAKSPKVCDVHTNFPYGGITSGSYLISDSSDLTSM